MHMPPFCFRLIVANEKRRMYPRELSMFFHVTIVHAAPLPGGISFGTYIEVKRTERVATRTPVHTHGQHSKVG